MNLSADDLSQVLQEITLLLVHGFVQKIHQPFPDIITLEIRQPGKTYTLLLSCHPHMARMHLISSSLSNPPTPPPFCQLLRSTILGCRLFSIEQIPQDRIVIFQFRSSDHLYRLIGAFIGRQANLFLTNGEQRILRSLKPDKQKAGEIYHPPSPHLQQETSSSYAHLPFNKSRNKSLLTTFGHSPGESGFPISSYLETTYKRVEKDQAEEQDRKVFRSVLTKELKKIQRIIQALSNDLEKAYRYREYGRYGELLKQVLSSITKGQSEIKVVDYYDPSLSDLLLPLDPAKDGQENMSDYFKKYRKFLGAQREIRPRLEQAERRCQELQAQLRNLDSDHSFPMISTCTTLSSPKSTPPSKKTDRSPKSKALPYRHFISAEGISIFVGKTAKDNEALTFRFAKPYDLWLHARGSPGSHVVISLEKDAVPPRETLRDAATLALFYSDLKKSGKGEVIYTYKKYVRKVKGGKPGSVLVTQDRSLWIQVDSERLTRLENQRIRSL